MRIRRIGWAAATAWMLIGLSGCGDHNNFFGSLADDNSIEAKIQEAQIALDNGDCQTAINGFTDAFNHDPSDVGIRVNLAAAYTCRAGFNIPALIRIVADFANSDQTADQFDLLKAIADATVNLVSASWDADTAQAVSLLTDLNLPVTGGCTPAPFAYNPDAAFNQAIVSTVRAVMAVTSLENAAGTVILTGNISPQLAALIGHALRDADSGITCADSIVVGSAIVESDVAEAISDLDEGVNDLNCPGGASDNDACHTDDVTVAELQQFLDDQGFTIN